MKTSTLFLAYCLGGFFLFFTACSGNSPRQQLTWLYIDNPTDTAITIQIDEQTIEVVANDQKQQQFPAGEHHLVSSDLDTIIRITGEAPIILNPTRSDYIKEEVIYSTTMSADLSNRPKGKYIPVQVVYLEDSIPVIGNFEKLNNILIWGYDYGLFVQPPGSLRGEIGDDFHKIKIYRMADFMKEKAKQSTALNQKQVQDKLGLSEPAPTAEKPKKKYDFAKLRKALILKSESDFPAPERGDLDRRLAVMEINDNGQRMLLAVQADQVATLFNSRGERLSEHMTTIPGKRTPMLSSATSFFNSVCAYRHEMEEVKTFPAPKVGEVRFHAWWKGAKYSKVVELAEMIRRTTGMHTSKPWDMQYSQGLRAVDYLRLASF